MVAPLKPLFLYEEIMLLALRDEAGVVATGFVEHAVAGAILAELLLECRLHVEDSRKQLVDLKDSRPLGDPIIDEAIEKIATAKRRASLQTWVTRLARMKDIRHRVARRLCDRQILRADEATILFFFTRKTYPEVNPKPEREIIERLRTAIFSDLAEIDPRTVVLISLAQGAEVLSQPFSRSELGKRKKRIDRIVNGEMTGKATQNVIAACRTAIMVAAIMPVMITTIHS